MADNIYTLGRETSEWVAQQYRLSGASKNPYGEIGGAFPFATMGLQRRQFKLTGDCDKPEVNDDAGAEAGEYKLSSTTGIAFQIQQAAPQSTGVTYFPDPGNDSTWIDWAKVPAYWHPDELVGDVILVNSLEIYLLEHDIVTAALIGGVWVIVDFMGPHVRHFQTPSGGIPAFSSGTFGEATCDVYQLAKDSSTGDVTYEALLDADGNQISQKVYNQASESVAGDEKIQATRMTGLWVANYEECSSG